MLYLVKFNYLTEKTGIDKFLKEGGAKLDSIGIIGTLFYWILMLIVLIATLNSLNLTVASTLFNEIMMYLPNIIVAIVILIIFLRWYIIHFTLATGWNLVISRI